jgi:hypothetical protein
MPERGLSKGFPLMFDSILATQKQDLIEGVKYFAWLIGAPAR